MRFRVDEKVQSKTRSGRFSEPAADEFANLYAAIDETLRHFDEQIGVAERELEMFRALRKTRDAARCEVREELSKGR
jgi:hypothetical protein